MHPKGMPRHYRRVRGGILYRSHVKKMCNGNCFHSECEGDACTGYMKVAKRSGMPSFESIHLQQCNEAYTIAPKQTLSLDSLKDLSGNGQLKLLSDSTISRRGALQESAKKEQSNLLVAVHDSERFIHFSVLDNEVHYYAKLGRVTVTADMLNGYLDCSCCARRLGCVLKAICK